MSDKPMDIGNLPQALIEDAIEKAERILTEAVEKSTDREDFFHRMAHAQIMDSHLLACLTFNAFIQSDGEATLLECLNQLMKGIRGELKFLGEQYAAGEMQETAASFTKGKK